MVPPARSARQGACALIVFCFRVVQDASMLRFYHEVTGYSVTPSLRGNRVNYFAAQEILRAESTPRFQASAQAHFTRVHDDFPLTRNFVCQIFANSGFINGSSRSLTSSTL